MKSKPVKKAKRLNVFRAKIIRHISKDAKPTGEIMYSLKIPEKKRKYYERTMSSLEKAKMVEYIGGYGWEATAKGKMKLKNYKKRKR